MAKTKLLAIFILLFGIIAAYFVAAPFLPESLKGFLPEVPFKLGLDLQGGVHLVYQADTSSIDSKEISESMAGLRDVIERRVNLFGVSEPVIQAEQSGNNNRLVVEPPGVTNVADAIALIGETPYREFKTQRTQTETDEILAAQKNNQRIYEDPYFIATDLTGRFLKKAVLNFNQTTYEPEVSLEFTSEGGDLFAKITKENVGGLVAIYLDGVAISIPNVNEEITGGKAQITGQFTTEEAKTLVRRLNSGALPVPISLVSQQEVGAILGDEVLKDSVFAGVIGILAVVLFLIFSYRLLGFAAVFALAIYIALVLGVYKIVPVTMTAAGITGFILSIGVAVDANILIFERIKEELRKGTIFSSAVPEGFKFAWTSIRDSNISTLITAAILFWFGTSVVKGFALTLGIGVLCSLFTSFTVVRIFLRAVNLKGEKKITRMFLGIPEQG